MIHGAWLWLVVNGLAVFRLTRLVAFDQITAGARKRLLNRATRLAFEHATNHGNVPTPHTSNVFGKAWELITCPWCLSIWVAAPVVAATRLAPTVWQYPAVGLALAAITGLLSELI